MSAPSRHPLITVAVIAVAGAAAVILVFVLVIVPLTRAAAQAPGQLAHAYGDYWNAVGQEFQQARQQDGGHAMTALIAVYSGDGCAGRCDAKCYNAWGPECHCICQGANHGAGKQEAIGNTRELAKSWLERAGAAGQVITLAELAVGAMHQPLSGLGGAR